MIPRRHDKKRQMTLIPSSQGQSMIELRVLASGRNGPADEAMRGKDGSCTSSPGW